MYVRHIGEGCTCATHLEATNSNLEGEFKCYADKLIIQGPTAMVRIILRRAMDLA